VYEFLTVAMFVTLIAAIIVFGPCPLAYTLAAVATLFGLIDNGFNITALFDMFANNAWGLMNNYVLVAIPLFILMAQLLDRSKVAEKLFEALYVVLGKPERRPGPGRCRGVHRVCRHHRHHRGLGRGHGPSGHAGAA
jgi:TRAP-type mannitol/chloroaromatic compound transport system permease large subunit